MRKSEKVTLRRTWTQATRAFRLLWRRFPGFFVAHTLCALFSALAPLTALWFSARILSVLTSSRDGAELTRLALGALLSALLLGLIGAALQHWKTFEEETVPREGVSRIFWEKTLDLDFIDADAQSVYELRQQIEQTITFTSGGLPKLLWRYEATLSALFQMLGGVSLSVSLFTAKVPDGSPLAFLGSPLFALGMVAVMLLFAGVSSACVDRALTLLYQQVATGRFGNRLFAFTENLSFDRKRALDLRIYRQFENVARDIFENGNPFSPTSPYGKFVSRKICPRTAISEALSMSLTGIVYAFVCLKAYAGAFDVGMVTQYIGASTTLFLGITSLLQSLSDLRSNVPLLETTFAYLDIPNRMYQGSLTTEKRSDREYEIEFRDVSFRYPGSSQYALRHVNMRFRVGSRLAVVGQNGSGKTTFIKLLCRLYDPTEGEILLNGINIRKYRYDDYMRIFSVVFQDFHLFALPLGQNVAARREYDEARVRDCLEKAGFGARLASLPKGLETCLYRDMDSEGVEISGGEAQKIAIARALYNDAPFIVLDEPTAALDPIAEAEIYEKFNEIAGDKTAIYISHRLSSCKFCDEIAVFDNGRVIQMGTHAALVEDANGKYYELWHAQAQYYTDQPQRAR